MTTQTVDGKPVFKYETFIKERGRSGFGFKMAVGIQDRMGRTRSGLKKDGYFKKS